jgi:hypothetical protein
VDLKQDLFRDLSRTKSYRGRTYIRQPPEAKVTGKSVLKSPEIACFLSSGSDLFPESKITKMMQVMAQEIVKRVDQTFMKISMIITIFPKTKLEANFARTNLSILLS